MNYTIYKITNNLNGKHYIGKHQTQNLNDGYMGSGKILKHAIKKYGIENFTKEILHVFETEDEMNAKEKELVTLDEMSYNLCPGGQGGFGYINSNGLGMNTDRAKIMNVRFMEKFSSNAQFRTEHTEKSKTGFNKEKLDKARKEKCPNGTFFGKSHRQESKEKIGKANSNRIPWNKGVPRTEEEKQKIRNSLLKK